ncbi:MAG: hypothetical protein FJ295_19065 [Planctomycetes bacterium]|nr:hypothetical protein [Planctomycetota bacterium]
MNRRWINTDSHPYSWVRLTIVLAIGLSTAFRRSDATDSSLSLHSTPTYDARDAGGLQTTPEAWATQQAPTEPFATRWEQSLPPDQLAPSGPLVPFPEESVPAVDLVVSDDGPRPPAWQLSGGWLPARGGNGFGMADFDLHRSAYIEWSAGRPPMAVTPGFGFHFWSGPAALDLPSRVYDLYLDVSGTLWESARTRLNWGITPGFYGDLRQWDRHAFQLTGWLLGDWAVSDRWTVVGGVAWVRQLRTSVLPVGGLIWADENRRVELVVPRPRLARRWLTTRDSEFWCYLAGQFGGGSWAIEQPDGTNLQMTYGDLRLTIGCEWSGPGRCAGQIEAGYVFARDISVLGSSVFFPSDTFLLQASLTR